MLRRFTPAAAVAVAVAATGATAASEEGGRREATASLGITINQGNTESQRYHLSAEYLERSNAHRYSANLELNRGQDDTGEEDVNNSRVGVGYDRFFHGPWYAYSSASWRQDRQADLRQRYVLSGGAGYQFFDSDRLRLSAETGPTYVSEQTIETEERTREAAARWALDYRQDLAEETLRLFHRHELIVVTNDVEQWFLTTRTGLRLPLRANLSASLQLNYDYDNSPPPSAESDYDATTLVNLTYSW